MFAINQPSWIFAMEGRCELQARKYFIDQGPCDSIFLSSSISLDPATVGRTVMDAIQISCRRVPPYNRVWSNTGALQCLVAFYTNLHA